MADKSVKSKSKKGDDGKSEKSSKSKSKEKPEKSKKGDKADKKSADKKSAKSKTPQKKQSKKKTAKQKNADNVSDVSSIQPTPPPSANCVHHKFPFIYFCETCEELICNQCTVYGPHNNHLHRILKITDAYRSRVFYLSQAIRTNLVDKRDKIIAQLHRLQYRIQEIRFVKNIIERDIRSEYSGIFQRLRSFQGTKLATLSHQVSILQREIDTINDLGNKFFQLTTLQGQHTQQQKKICRFLMKSKQMYEAIDYLLNKPDRPIPDIAIHQLPKQVQVNKQKIQKALAAKQINNFKNQVIWNLLADLKGQEFSLKKEADVKASALIKDLSQQAQGLSQKLQTFKLICSFCGMRMNPQNVNSQCSMNSEQQHHHQMPYPTIKKPQGKQIGNKRHFFSKAIEQQ